MTPGLSRLSNRAPMWLLTAREATLASAAPYYFAGGFQFSSRWIGSVVVHQFGVDQKPALARDVVLLFVHGQDNVGLKQRLGLPTHEMYRLAQLRLQP